MSTVLVVCHANMCRSPIGALLLAEALAPLGWDIASRGTHARNGAAMCMQASKALGHGHAASAFVSGFTARRLSDADLDSPLLLAASGAEKSVLARLDHSTRSRTFTLREAAALAESDPRGLSRLASDPSAVAAHLDGVRRTMVRDPDHDEFDIPDAHMRRWVRHDRTVAAVADASRRLAGVLVRNDRQ